MNSKVDLEGGELLSEKPLRSVKIKSKKANKNKVLAEGGSEDEEESNQEEEEEEEVEEEVEDEVEDEQDEIEEESEPDNDEYELDEEEIETTTKANLTRVRTERKDLDIEIVEEVKNPNIFLQGLNKMKNNLKSISNNSLLIKEGKQK